MRLQEEENRQIAADYERTAGTATPDSVSQQQGQGLSQALPADGQRRRVERGERKDKEDKSVSMNLFSLLLGKGCCFICLLFVSCK